MASPRKLAEAPVPGIDPSRFPIGDHGAIGDCRSVALIARDGTLNWLCWPTFSSPALFAGLIDRKAGYFRVGPLEPARISRRYLPDTNVLETEFSTDKGRWRLTDLMPVPPSRCGLRPARELIRLVEVLDGTIEFSVDFRPRPDFGRRLPIRRRGDLGWALQWRGELTSLHTDLALVAGEEGLSGRFQAEAGSRHVLWLTHTAAEPSVIPSLDQAQARLEETIGFWRGWIAKCTYRGANPQAIRRSLLALKLLTYAPSGAVVAAATTSLPEAVGGQRNWDYRYCWLRDSSLTFRVFNDTGFGEEAGRYLRWLVMATRLTAPELQVVYDVYGRTDLVEVVLDRLSGWRGHYPVRIGNDAHLQFQLDLYGEAMATVAACLDRGGMLHDQEYGLLEGWADTVTARWREPDSGIWEVRTKPRHFTYSKAMAWATLDGLARILEAQRPMGWQTRRDRLRQTAAAIQAEVEKHGVDPATGGYVSAFGEDDVDASLLLLPWFGFADATSPRMRATLARIIDELDCDGLIKRYRTGFDGFHIREGAFVACGFWAADCLARSGYLKQAEDRFQRLTKSANDLGLFAEEIDWATKLQLGNFPQAFSHIALINAAMTMEDESRMGRGVSSKP